MECRRRCAPTGYRCWHGRSTPVSGRGFDEAGSFAQSISCIVDLGDTAFAIARLAKQESPDLIVMAASGQRGLARLSTGSTVAATLRQAQVPILFLGSSGPKQATPKATNLANRVLTA